MMKSAKIITVACHKGGVAKSQTAIEMSYYLAAKGSKVLILDVDPQGNTSNVFLAGNKIGARSIAAILTDDGVIHASDTQTRTFASGVTIDYICSDIQSVRLESRLTAVPKEYIMSDALREIAELYDYIIIDTPPSSELLGLSSLLASDEVVIPVTPDQPGIDGVQSVMKVVALLQNNARLNPSLVVRGIVITRYRHTNIMRECMGLLKVRYGELVVDRPIRECIRVQQAVKNCRPILDYDDSCAAAGDYMYVFERIFNTK
jgi:chromosome partitioning protein